MKQVYAKIFLNYLFAINFINIDGAAIEPSSELDALKNRIFAIFEELRQVEAEANLDLSNLTATLDNAVANINDANDQIKMEMGSIEKAAIGKPKQGVSGKFEIKKTLGPDDERERAAIEAERADIKRERAKLEKIKIASNRGLPSWATQGLQKLNKMHEEMLRVREQVLSVREQAFNNRLKIPKPHEDGRGNPTPSVLQATQGNTPHHCEARQFTYPKMPHMSGKYEIMYCDDYDEDDQDEPNNQGTIVQINSKGSYQNIRGINERAERNQRNTRSISPNLNEEFAEEPKLDIESTLDDKNCIQKLTALHNQLISQIMAEMAQIQSNTESHLQDVQAILNTTKTQVEDIKAKITDTLNETKTTVEQAWTTVTSQIDKSTSAADEAFLKSETVKELVKRDVDRNAIQVGKVEGWIKSEIDKIRRKAAEVEEAVRTEVYETKERFKKEIDRARKDIDQFKENFEAALSGEDLVC